MTVALVIGVTALLSLAMMFAWVVQRRLANAGWVDVIWSFALGLAGAIYALAPPPGTGWPGKRQWIVAVLAVAWSLRLGLHILDRTRNGPEDARYAQFRRDWGAAFEPRMFALLQIQAGAAALLAISVLLAARNPRPIGVPDGIGILVLLVAIAGEARADAQLRRFRAAPGSHGRVCDVGLWRLSRHPNYFFQWLGWLAYPLLAIAPGAPFGWLALTGPAFMYWLLVHVSGIPPLERQMLRSRGAAYAAYQARTSAFLPLPPARTP